MEINFPENLTSSLDLDGCDYRHAIGRILNLRQARTYERNLDFGGAFAEALYLARKAYYIKLVSRKEAEEEATDYVDTIFSPLFSKEMAERKKDGRKEERIKTPERLQHLLELYFSRFQFGKENIAPFLLNDEISAEQVVKIELFPEVNLAVKPDMIAIKADGSYSILLDEKTVGNAAKETSWPEYVYMARPQFNLYSYVLNEAQKRGELNIPPIKEMEVRRAVIQPTLTSAGDYVHPINYALDEGLLEEVFTDFFYITERRLESFNAFKDEEIEHVFDAVKTSRGLLSKYFRKNWEMCYQYGKPCPLIEHCTVGRNLGLLGFKESKVDTVTKEITFEEE